VESIKEFLEAMVEMKKKMSRPEEWKYGSIEEFILAHGRPFESVKEPPRRGKMKECFKNATELSLHDRRYIYVEGYAIRQGIGLPLHHAWCVDKEGTVYDPTWEEGTEYYGVPFEHLFVVKMAFKAETYGLLDLWHLQWPLLQSFDVENIETIEGAEAP